MQEVFSDIFIVDEQEIQRVSGVGCGLFPCEDVLLFLFALLTIYTTYIYFMYPVGSL